jgi:hypothetical protein
MIVLRLENNAGYPCVYRKPHPHLIG